MTNLFNKNPLKLKISDILIYSLALIPFLSTVIYYIYSLNNISLVFLAISLLFLVYLFSKERNNEYKKNDNEKNNNKNEIKGLKNLNNLNKFSISKKSLIFLLLFLISITLSFILLFQSKEDGSIISPFEKINTIFFIFYFLSTLSLLI
ncbi:MAG: hypothetical protein PF488_03450, partial [Patescibacteria group bacterium]|nr:hypothetical protein [Patescibacteria group bacterium]